MIPTSTLPAIAALVRAGAVERGGELFAAGGFAARIHDPAALAVKGRLLKTRGLGATGDARRALMAEAAGAYAEANALSPAPYLAVNAATLHLLAGAGDSATSGAQGVMAMLDGSSPPADTPYYLAATRAEALLLLGDRSGAERAMAEAVQHDPDGWDDRAVTLAQLREVVAAQGGDATWLELFAPPSSLHYAGHMGIAASGQSEAYLAAELTVLLADLKLGFAWGALAAGADLIIVEHLLARGCEVHAVLPCPPDQFEAQSVAPAGPEWTRRFHAVLPQCASLRIASPTATSVHDPLATGHAGELAIGGAALNAARFGTAVSQLIVSDERGGGANTARQAELWRSEMGGQHRLTVPRDVTVAALYPPEAPDPARQLVLVAAIGIDALMQVRGLASDEIRRLSAAVAEALSELPAGSIRASQGLWELAAADLAAGLEALTRVGDACRAAGDTLPAIGAHLAICDLIVDPASQTAIPYGSAPQVARELMQHAPAGVVLVSDALAVALAAHGTKGLRTELYLPGDPENGGSAHLLRTASQ